MNLRRGSDHLTGGKMGNVGAYGWDSTSKAFAHLSRCRLIRLS